MMSVLEYAQDVNKSVSEILNLCKKLNIAVLGEDDYLDATEVAKSYKYADKGSIEGEEDGKVEANGVRDFAAWFLPNSGNSQEYIDALYEGYLEIYS